MDWSLPGSSDHGISQVRILEWIAISFSRGSSWPMDWTQVFCIAGRFFTAWAILHTFNHQIPPVKLFSHVRLFATSWTVACQAPPSRGFSRQEYWSGLPFPFPGDLPDPGIKPWPPALQADLYWLSYKIASFWCHFILTFPGNGSLALEARFRLTFLPESFTDGALSWILNHWTTREVPRNNYFMRACKYGAFLLESLFYKWSRSVVSDSLPSHGL